MENQYKVIETENRMTLVGKNGNSLVSFTVNEENTLKVTYENANIDQEGLLIKVSDVFGSVNECVIECSSKKECLLCLSRSLSLCKNNLGNWEQVKCLCPDSNSSIDFYNYRYEVMLERCNEVITIKCNNKGDEKFLGKINKSKAPRNVFSHNVIDDSEEKISRLLEEYGMLKIYSSLVKKKHRFHRRIRAIRRMLSKYGYSLLNLSH